MATISSNPVPWSPLKLGRRGFLAAVGASAAAAHFDLFRFAATLCASEPKPAGGPRIGVAFIRPEKPEVVSWPGGNCDTNAQQALFTRTLGGAAKELDVRLDVREKPMNQASDVDGWLESVRAAPPDGLIICAMELFGGWDLVNRILAARGDIPTIVYSNMSGFTDHLQCARTTPKAYLAATQDVGWLAHAVRMLRTIWGMRNTRILVLAGTEASDAAAEGLGTIFHAVPRSRFDEMYAKVGETDEARAMADFYAKSAQKIVEPTPADILAAARNYLVCRRLLEAEQCHGITIDCLGWKNPVCIAFSRLMDEGLVAACEADRAAALGQLLTTLLFDRPGFIVDPSPNTVNNTLIGSHCTSPTKLEGVHESYRAPFVIRNYHTCTGASMQVLWPVGKDVTVIDFLDPKTLALATGRVRSNIAQPPSGCCRTAVEIELDGVTDSHDLVDARSAKGFHQLFIAGNLGRAFKAYAQLAGLTVVPMCA
jgi:hypothetical protein